MSSIPLSAANSFLTLGFGRLDGRLKVVDLATAYGDRPYQGEYFQAPASSSWVVVPVTLVGAWWVDQGRRELQTHRWIRSLGFCILGGGDCGQVLVA
jgi:hypothetical protein